MEEQSRDHLRALGQLAREYEKKLHELEDAVKNTKPEMVPHMLRLRGELTTDHFRAAQVALLKLLADDTSPEGETAYKAATALCRAFDEMRILLQISLELSLEHRD